MLVRVWVFLERHATILLGALTTILFALWIASQFVNAIQLFLQKWDVYTIMIVTFTATTLSELLKLKPEYERRRKAHVFADQLEAREDLQHFVASKRIAEADLLEYSTGTIHEFLEQLKACNCKIRILMKNPDAGVADYQKRKIAGKLDQLLNGLFKDYHNVEIRCYAAPASLRGGKLNNQFITLGWYTYTDSSNQNGLYGHTNCMVSAYISTEEGRKLQKMFDQAFVTLWEDRKTIPASIVLETIRATAGGGFTN